MSQIKIIVRQPPNRDFLEGFPGIPPNAPERPHAALRGTVELRVQGGTPVKAKWVQIELKKIETLLQGQGEPYVETIGHAPKIWTANGEYENLQVRDFPFYIQIPMNVPPSIALEKGSGIRYEMVASLCVKGKKGLLRKDKNNVTSTSVPIVMDKHELHTLWPVYHRPQTSTATNDGLNLIVTRDASCYGPGDSVTAHVELRSGRTSPCILRAWEMTLREHVIFRPDPSQVNNHSKQAPVANGQQYRHNVIAEQKKSLSRTIYEGVTVEDELACLIPMQHRTATTQGRLIEVQFTLSVKAVMESAGSVEVMMPVLMSHWSKEMSENALRKIGPVPHLGINFPPAQPAKQQQPQGYSQLPSNGQLNAPYNNAPPMESPPVRPQIPKNEMPPEEVGPPSPPYTPPETGVNFSSQQSANARQNGRPRESTITSRSRTLAVVNIGPTEEAPAAAQSTSTGPPAQPYKASWETAEEEKKRLKDQFSQTQGQSSGSAQPATNTPIPSTPVVKPTFSSAEDEKERLYKRAQAQARRTQELARKEQGLPPRSPGMGAISISRETSASASASDSSAMRPATANTITSVASSTAPITAMPITATPITPPATAGKAPSIRSESTTPGTPNWASAEAEKERLYRAAQRRARETQARVASASGSMTGRSRSGSNTSLTSMTTARQSTIQGARPASTFKLNNPDPPEVHASAPAQAVSPAPAPSVSPAPAPSISPAPAPAPVNTPPGSSAASAAQQMYAQAMAQRQSQPAPAPGRQSAAYAASPAQPAYGHASHASQTSSAGYSQTSGSQSGSSLPPSYAAGGSSVAPGGPPGPPGQNWSSAETEKAQLNLYYEAKRAVSNRAEGSMDDAMAGSSGSAYVPGHSASPSPPSTHNVSPSLSQRVMASPPPTTPYGSAAPMRMNSVQSVRQEQTPSPVYNRAYPQQSPTPPVPHGSPPADYFNQPMQRSHTPQYSAPAPPAFSPSARNSTAPLPMDEKERMKLFFEAQDAARRYQDTQGAGGSGSGRMSVSPPPPAPSASSHQTPPKHAGPPGYDDAPPAFDGGSSRPMSALEEKARLAREYQMQQQGSQGPLSRASSIQSVRSPGPSQMPQYAVPPMQSPQYSHNGLPPLSTQYVSPPMARSNSAFKFIPSPIEEEPPAGPPPPLMPRPPQEYIEQIIQEEDGEAPPPALAPEPQARSPPSRQGTWDSQPLSFRPVSPFSIPLPNAQSPPPPQNQHWQQPPPAQPQYVQQYPQQPQAPYYR